MTSTRWSWWQKFALIGVVFGIINFLIVLQVYVYYVEFGSECIPPGEPFLTCGPTLLKMYYFVFFGQRSPVFMFFVNVIAGVIAFLVLGVIYKTINRFLN